MRALALTVAVASALLLAATTQARPDAFKPRKCGEITVRKGANDYTYRIKVFQAPLACSTAQLRMTQFILSGRVPKRSFCRYGHSRDAWAATCAGTTKNAPIIRAYLVAG
jgi:hypothetical protein